MAVRTFDAARLGTNLVILVKAACIDSPRTLAHFLHLTVALESSEAPVVS